MQYLHAHFKESLNNYEHDWQCSVVQLWQRDRAKLETFSINVHRCSQNHAQKCIVEPPYMEIMDTISALSESFNAKKLYSRVSLRKLEIRSVEHGICPIAEFTSPLLAVQQFWRFGHN